ncbi:carboxyltransferase domain-containing protein [Natrarchaeobius halalkaliphilus]|uniref:Carboxyltransferase domain-containing protein n=1 Tax=Natrarchaeobius halalkaliphilus TaxID=1679091 RepID=A0A3N6LMI6_9EURY|nr:carboxyltransferase domain-containing protein [Natrarchaeobius halalkaliphilus]RQG89027.1 carboxyltransferase domain-containing protein [Natrarchaeobius halalkaliphilus]
MANERITPDDLPEPRYEYGADDHVFVELAEAMSFTANVKAMAITQQVAEREIDGVIENCPANASYMLRIDPEVIHPDDLIAQLREIESDLDLTEYEWDTRLIDVPVLFQDPWTHETLMEFRDRHQDADATDLEYSAQINGYDSVEAFLDAFVGAPHMVTMVGFVPGLPWCFQMVPRSEQLEVPKYVEPRTDTPSRAVGFGGAFSVIYPVQGAGGYQLYGRTPIEVLDVDQILPDFRDSMVFPNPGDILNYRRIDRDTYDEIRESVEAGEYEYTYQRVSFSPDEFFESPHEYTDDLTAVIE